MIFGNNIFFKIILTFSIFILISLFSFDLFKKEPIYNSELLKNLKNTQFKYIAHAGGGIENIKYTNSVEALHQSIDLGFKIIEIDLMETLDNKFVGVHDWASFKRNSSYKNTNDEPILYNDFLNLKIFNKFKPLEINEINKIFNGNKEIFLLTDKTNNFDKIYKDFNFDKNRILIEIFGKKNFIKSVKNKIINPVYSFNHKDYDFVLKNNIKIVSAHTEDISMNKDIYSKLIEKEIFVFAYTSNNEQYINNNLDKFFTNIYTDFWDLKNNKCLSTVCETY